MQVSPQPAEIAIVPPGLIILPVTYVIAHLATATTLGSISNIPGAPGVSNTEYFRFSQRPSVRSERGEPLLLPTASSPPYCVYKTISLFCYYVNTITAYARKILKTMLKLPLLWLQNYRQLQLLDERTQEKVRFLTVSFNQGRQLWHVKRVPLAITCSVR